jgi:bifunctional DNase/RNase
MEDDTAVIIMQIREVANCTSHRRTRIVMEDASGEWTLTFFADFQESQRLVREIQRGRNACNPVGDFIVGLLRALQAPPLRVVLDDVEGAGIGGHVYVGQGGLELEVQCYPPDALALALRTQVPIYATSKALDHAVASTPGGGEPAARPEPVVRRDGGDIARWLERVRPGDFSAGARPQP